jgi:hypothetical protein
MASSKKKAFIVTLRRAPSMAVEAYYMLSENETSAARAVKWLCRAPSAVVLDVTPDRPQVEHQMLF